MMVPEEQINFDFIEFERYLFCKQFKYLHCQYDMYFYKGKWDIYFRQSVAEYTESVAETEKPLADNKKTQKLKKKEKSKKKKQKENIGEFADELGM